MCLAFPGKVERISEGFAIVDYGSEKREAKILGPVPKKGDWVLVSAGIVSEIVPENEARKMVEAWSELSE
ncbi:MAG: HypC/HybG/HupF family hydrogenase formation chaperone [Candidatus Micrarchaeota archaeon]